METGEGAQLARLLLDAFEACVGEVVAELGRAGHPGLTAAHEFALQAVDDGATSAASLARRLGVTRQAAAKTITTLEGLGYVVRGSDGADARRKDLRLTEHAREAIAVGSAAFDRIEQQWVAVVGPDQVAATASALRVLRDGLRSGGLAASGPLGPTATS